MLRRTTPEFAGQGSSWELAQITADAVMREVKELIV